MPAKNTTNVAVVALLFIGLGIALFVTLPKGGSNTRVLPDGTVIQLGSVSAGKVHRYVTGNMLQQTVGRFLPDKAAEYIGARVHEMSNSAGELAAFIRLTHQVGTRSGPGGYVAMEITVSDDAGNEFACAGESYRSQTATELVTGFPIPMGDHLGKHIRLKVATFDYNYGSNVEGSFEFENPLPRRMSHWAAEDFPATNQVGDFPVKLQSLTHNRWPEPDENSMRVEFAGLNTNEWRAAYVYIEDEAGKSYHPTRSFYHSTQEWNFGGLLSPDEPWRIHCEFERVSGFSSNEVWISEPISLADLPTNHLAFTSASAEGFNVVISKLNRRDVELTITPSPFPAHYRWQLKARDANGVLTRIEGGGGGDYGSRIQYAYPINLTNAASPVRFVLSMAKCQEADFVVRPEKGK